MRLPPCRAAPHRGLHPRRRPDRGAARSLALPDDSRPIAEPYVCIAVQSTTQCKYWNNPAGWREIVRFLKDSGLSGHLHRPEARRTALAWSGTTSRTAPRTRPATSRWPSARAGIKHADFFVGLSSGLSWLAWASGTPVVMISGFTHPTNEFATPYRVINYHACNSCWNDPAPPLRPQGLPVVPAPQGHAAPVRMHAAHHRRACEECPQDHSRLRRGQGKGRESRGMSNPMSRSGHHAGEGGALGQPVSFRHHLTHPWSPAAAPVLVVGNSMLDVYVLGAVDRIFARGAGAGGAPAGHPGDGGRRGQRRCQHRRAGRQRPSRFLRRSRPRGSASRLGVDGRQCHLRSHPDASQADHSQDALRHRPASAATPRPRGCLADRPGPRGCDPGRGRTAHRGLPGRGDVRLQQGHADRPRACRRDLARPRAWGAGDRRSQAARLRRLSRRHLPEAQPRRA